MTLKHHDVAAAAPNDGGCGRRGCDVVGWAVWLEGVAEGGEAATTGLWAAAAMVMAEVPATQALALLAGLHS